MESGGLIEDTIAADRVKNKADDGAAGVVWSQGGAVTMKEGLRICGAIGRAIYMDGGFAAAIINGNSRFTVDGGSVLRGGKNGVNITSGSLYMNGEITGYTCGGHVVHMTSHRFRLVKRCLNTAPLRREETFCHFL